MKIPAGQVRSYAWVAKKIGKPEAVRAVGQAVKKNPYPVVVPCHRVIRADGSIGGFSLGVKKKKELLAREGIECRGSSVTRGSQRKRGERTKQ